jgi:hypothetical protein
VIDEVGYLSYGPDAANVLFHVVNERYLHHRPMIFTTNKPLSAWGRVLHDSDLAQAILGRVLERGRHLELRGGPPIAPGMQNLTLPRTRRHHPRHLLEFPETGRENSGTHRRVEANHADVVRK